MIEYKKGDLFADYHPLIVHGCNARGVMGSGFAKQIRQRFPEAYKSYSKAWMENKLTLGYVQLAIVQDTEYRDLYIANCVTQDAYGLAGIQYVSYEAIEECMKGINTHMKWATKLRPDFWTHIAMPKIGAGLGGGDWNRIESIINHSLGDFKVVVYEL